MIPTYGVYDESEFLKENLEKKDLNKIITATIISLGTILGGTVLINKSQQFLPQAYEYILDLYKIIDIYK